MYRLCCMVIVARLLMQQQNEAFARSGASVVMNDVWIVFRCSLLCMLVITVAVSELLMQG